MDLASTLLTKKAALIGGGTAATTTAVVVPVAVTQSQKEKKSPTPSKEEQISGESETGGGSSPSDNDTTSGLTDENGLKENPLTQLSLNLDQTDGSLFDSFNKPGDCIKKSFYKVEEEVASKSNDYEKGLFRKPKSLRDPGTSHTKFDPTSLTNSDNSKPNIEGIEYGCFMFNKFVDENNTDYRFEVVLKKGDYGWLWMSGRKGNDIFFREAVVHKPKNQNPISKWEGYAAIDGKYPDANKEIIPKFEDAIFGDLGKWKTKDCDNNNQNCKDKESIGGVFIKEENGDKKFLPSNEADWTNSILSLSSDRSYAKKENGNKRWSFFGGGGWYKNNTSQETVIEFDKSKIIDTLKGNWKDLIDYCRGTNNNSHSAFAALCPAPQ